MGREQMIEAAAEANEEYMDKYLEGEELTYEEIKKGLRDRTIANEIVLATCGSAFKHRGVQAVLDAVIEFLPAPDEVKAIRGEVDDEGTEETRPVDDDAPFAALAFKIATDPKQLTDQSRNKKQRINSEQEKYKRGKMDGTNKNKKRN